MTHRHPYARDFDTAARDFTPPRNRDLERRKVLAGFFIGTAFGIGIMLAALIATVPV